MFGVIVATCFLRFDRCSYRTDENYKPTDHGKKNVSALIKTSIKPSLW